MRRTRLGTITHSVLTWDDRDNRDWDDWDILGWDGWDGLYSPLSGYLIPSGRELAAYMAGTAAVAFFVLRGRILLDYPLTLLPPIFSSTQNTNAMFSFCAICLGMLALGLLAVTSDWSPPTVADGLLAPYAALGFYLFPQLTIHPPFLVVAVAASTALTAWDIHSYCRAPSFPKVTWQVAINVALVTIPLFCLCRGGIVPMAAADPSSAETTGGVAAIERVLNEASLDGMSYQEVADAMQSVVRIEAERLGLEGREPRVIVGYTGTALSSYAARDNTIILNASLLRKPRGLSGYDAVDSIAHEMAHAYQHAMVNGTIANTHTGPLGKVTEDDVVRWREEMGANVDSSRHFDEYWNQDIEKRARDYANREKAVLVAMAYGYLHVAQRVEQHVG